MGIGERIRQVRGSANRDEFSSKFGVSKNTIGRYESGQSSPNAKFLKKLCEVYDVNLDWLMYGTGPVHRQELNCQSDNFEFIPMAEAKLSAGGGAFVISESYRDYYAFRSDWLSNTLTSVKNAVLMRVTGDSMEPTIYDGDIVMLDTGRTHVYDGSIYALRMDDTIMIKRLSLRPGDKIRVISDNRREYEPYETGRADVHVIAQVVWFARTLVKPE